MTDDKQERDGPRHDLNVDHSYNFEGVKVKSLSDGCALNTRRQPQTDALKIARDALEAAPLIVATESAESFKARQDAWLNGQYRAALKETT